MNSLINDVYCWSEVLDAEVYDWQGIHLPYAPLACPQSESFLHPTTERVKTGFGALERAINSLEQTLSRIYALLNKNSSEGIIKEWDDFEMNKPFIVDGKTYYHPISGERVPVRPLHPYEAFETDELPLLDEEKLNKYKDMKVMAQGNKALAFFFYKNMGLSVTTKRIICRIFRAYLKEMRTVSHENIFIYVKRLDSRWNRSYHYLSKIIMCICRVVTFSYKFKTNFPKIKLNTKRKPKVEVSLVTPNQILLTHKILLKMKNREYALLLRMMYAFALMPYELRMLRFEDVHELDNGRKLLKFYHPRFKRCFELNLSEGLYREIKDFEEETRERKSGLKTEVRTICKSRRTTGSFIFSYSIRTIQRLFKNGFNGNVPGFSFWTGDIRTASKLTQN